MRQRTGPPERSGGLIWRLYLTATLLPLWGVVAWLLDVEPGAGPQGGEAAFLLIVLFVLMWLPATLVNGLRLVVIHRRMTAGPVARTFALWLLFWMVYVPVLFRLVDRASAIDASASARLAATVVFAGLGVALYLGNLWLLGRAGRAVGQG